MKPISLGSDLGPLPHGNLGLLVTSPEDKQADDLSERLLKAAQAAEAEANETASPKRRAALLRKALVFRRARERLK